jgi:hypothetical protein
MQRSLFPSYVILTFLSFSKEKNQTSFSNTLSKVLKNTSVLKHCTFSDIGSTYLILPIRFELVVKPPTRHTSCKWQKYPYILQRHQYRDIIKETCNHANQGESIRNNKDKFTCIRKHNAYMKLVRETNVLKNSESVS